VRLVEIGHNGEDSPADGHQGEKKPSDENTIEAHGDPQYGSAILSGFNTG
jgi:hypothetical protein